MPDQGQLIDTLIDRLPPEAKASVEAQQVVADAVRAGYEAGQPAAPNPVFVQRVDTFKDGKVERTEWELVDRRRPKGERIVDTFPDRKVAQAEAAKIAPVAGGTIQAQWDDSNEYLHDTDMEAVGNMALYNVISGCGFTEGATMDVTVAAGSITHNGAGVMVSGGTATLVADATNKQWGYIAFSSAGAVQVVTGSPAANASTEPTKPELGDRVWGKAYKIEAAQTASNAITTALDKRIPDPKPGYRLVGSNASAQTTTSTSAVDLVTISLLPNVLVTQPLVIEGVYSKSAGAANIVSFGLKLNSDIVIEPDASDGIANTSATSQAEDGMFRVIIEPRSASFRLGITSYFVCRVTATGANAVAPGFGMTGTLDALLPNATLTSLAIRAINNTANNNATLREVYVYAGKAP